MKSVIIVVPLLLSFLVLCSLNNFDFHLILKTVYLPEPFDWHEIGTALYCGAIVGWERMLNKKVLGMRTCIFILLGTYIFTAISLMLTAKNNLSDTTRVVGQIVSGIGFLGAGVMFNKGTEITGLTSAATIWMLAAIGVCIGIGYTSTAVIVTTLGVVLLIVVNEIDEPVVKATKKITKAFKK